MHISSTYLRNCASADLNTVKMPGDPAGGLHRSRVPAVDVQPSLQGGTNTPDGPAKPATDERMERQSLRAVARSRTKVKPCSPSGAGTDARPNRKISLKNRKIIGRLGLRGFQPEMRGAALASLNEQFPFD
jgi:hypothetical protein